MASKLEPEALKNLCHFPGENITCGSSPKGNLWPNNFNYNHKVVVIFVRNLCETVSAGTLLMRRTERHRGTGSPLGWSRLLAQIDHILLDQDCERREREEVKKEGAKNKICVGKS